MFEQLLTAASLYKERTGRYLQIWGELGELYAEIKFGLKRHRVNAAGSDGRLGNDFVEVKTISPEKSKGATIVKRSGHFNKVLIVKIGEGFDFDAVLIDRKTLGKGRGKHARIPWNG